MRFFFQGLCFHQIVLFLCLWSATLVHSLGPGMLMACNNNLISYLTTLIQEPALVKHSHILALLDQCVPPCGLYCVQFLTACHKMSA